MTEYTDVFDGFVEKATVFRWEETEKNLIIDDIKLDEDATVHIDVTDERTFESDTITLDDLATKVRNGRLIYMG